MLQKCWVTFLLASMISDEKSDIIQFVFTLLTCRHHFCLLSFFLFLAFRSWLGSILVCISLGLSWLGFNSFLNLWVNIFCQVQNTFSHYFVELFFSLTLLPFSGKTRYDLTYPWGSLHFFFSFSLFSFCSSNWISLTDLTSNSLIYSPVCYLALPESSYILLYFSVLKFSFGSSL